MMSTRPDMILLSPLVVLLGLVVLGLFIAAIAGKGRTRSFALGGLVIAIIGGLLFREVYQP